jgi:hypothetical protein
MEHPQLDQWDTNGLQTTELKSQDTLNYVHAPDLMASLSDT